MMQVWLPALELAPQIVIEVWDDDTHRDTGGVSGLVGELARNVGGPAGVKDDLVGVGRVDVRGKVG